jgi:hypothetical protein
MVVTGSANLTSAPWGRNVEFGVTLVGPTSKCGVDAVLTGSGESPGLLTVLEDAPDLPDDGLDDPTIKTSRVLELFHRTLAVSEPVVHIAALDESGGGSTTTVRAALTLAVSGEPPGSKSTVWLASLPRDTRQLNEPLHWSLALANVTPFVAIRTTLGEGDTEVEE